MPARQPCCGLPRTCSVRRRVIGSDGRRSRTSPPLSNRRCFERERGWRGYAASRRVAPNEILEQLAFDGALDRPCRELSFGNLRKVLLADAFSSRADLIVIDEATEGLDSHGAAALVELMVEARTRDASVLFAEQQTQRMAGADRLVSVQRGTLVVESVSAAGEVTVSLRGPADALGELTRGAEALGFRYVVERE